MARRKVLRHLFRFNGFWQSVGVATVGIIYLFRYHRNMRIMFMMGVASFLAGLLLRLNAIELVALCITITVVFIAEIFNTAIEILMNILTTRYHLKIKLVKDIAAAVALLACLNAVAVGYILFARKICQGLN